MYNTSMKPYNKLFRWIPAILIGLFIFTQSGLNGSESTAISLPIVEWIMNFFSFIDKDILHHLVRKAAHFSEYFLFGGSILYAMDKDFTVARFALFCVLVPICDETIQHFTPGRAAQMTDCLLDASGMICAAFIGIWLKKHIGRYII